MCTHTASVPAKMSKLTPTRKIKLCSICGRKQYIKSSICLCGHIPYEDTLDDASKKELRLNQLRTILDNIYMSQRKRYLVLTLCMFKDFVIMDKHEKRRKLHIPKHSTHASRAAELKQYLKDRAADKKKGQMYLSMMKKEEQRGYLKELQVGLQQQKDKLVVKDLEKLGQNYIKIRQVNQLISGSTASKIIMTPHDGDRRRKIVKNGELLCASRERPLSFNDSNSVEESIALMKSENELLIQARMKKNFSADRFLSKRMTREQLARENKARRFRDKKRREALQIQMEQEENVAKRRQVAQARGSELLLELLKNWQLERLNKGWRSWFENTRLGKADCSKEAMREMNMKVAKHHQKMGLARRLRPLVGQFRVT